MCGFFGTIRDSSEFGHLAASTMIDRGPDFLGFDEIVVNHVRMWHTRLSILDLSHHSHQPIRSESGRYMMSFNGEIFNYKDFGVYSSDTLMLVDQIELFGFSGELLQRMNGQFSMAVFDRRDEVLYLATDPFSQKPCYYCKDGNQFCFSSTPGAITFLKDKWELDREALDQLFILGSIPFDKSLFKGIKKLPGGYMARFDLKSGELKLEKWWSIAPAPVPDLEELVFDAIDKVKVADVPVNIYLSGGIDSTLVASRFTGAKAIHLQSEEQKYAELVAGKHGIDLQICPLDFDRDKVLQDYARKTGDCAMSAIQPYIVSEQARKFGKVAVIANGADELFYGYDRTHDPKGLRHMMRPGYESIMADMERLYLDEYELCGPDQFERLLELRIYIQNDLNKTLDFASMCNSVEVRSPFLDPRLINAALGLRYEAHTSKAYGGKTILKKMLSRLGYNHQFLTRPKQGFSMPKNLQSNSEDLDWCVQNGFVKRNPQWSVRDRVYSEATASSFRNWFKVWENKLTL